LIWVGRTFGNDGIWSCRFWRCGFGLHRRFDDGGWRFDHWRWRRRWGRRLGCDLGCGLFWRRLLRRDRCLGHGRLGLDRLFLYRLNLSDQSLSFGLATDSICLSVDDAR